MKYKFEFEATGAWKDFERGCCDECPLAYIGEDLYGDYTYNCVLHANYNKCPLEEVKE